jgi:Gamma tubulin complex component C-terminal
LDFLQLQYKAPFPLDAIITGPILEKYDRVFMLIIKLFRMQSVAAQLFRDGSSRTSYAQGIDPLTRRFRIEAHHFITVMSSYIFHVSIETNWHDFQRKLNEIEASLGTRGAKTSISEMRELHGRTLDNILYACFLKRRQGPILTLLYATLEPVLLFAKTSRTYARREQRAWSRMREEMADNTRILYSQFVRKAGMFVRVVRELERKGVGTGNSAGEGLEAGWIADLLVRLDGTYFDR